MISTMNLFRWLISTTRDLLLISTGRISLNMTTDNLLRLFMSLSHVSLTHTHIYIYIYTHIYIGEIQCSYDRSITDSKWNRSIIDYWVKLKDLNYIHIYIIDNSKYQFKLTTRSSVIPGYETRFRHIIHWYIYIYIYTYTKSVISS